MLSDNTPEQTDEDVVPFFEQVARNHDALQRLEATYVPVWSEGHQKDLTFEEYLESWEMTAAACEFEDLHKAAFGENVSNICLYPARLKRNINYVVDLEMCMIYNILDDRIIRGEDTCGLDQDDFDFDNVPGEDFSWKKYRALATKEKRTDDEQYQLDVTNALMHVVNNFRKHKKSAGDFIYVMHYAESTSGRTPLVLN